jgi:hypothetical protein
MMLRSRQQALARAGAAALLLSAAALLPGCSASLIADHMPAAVGGLPSETPERSAVPPPYPAVHDMPPQRSDTMLSDDQQKKLESDLIAARNRVTPASDASAYAGSTPGSSTGSLGPAAPATAPDPKAPKAKAAKAKSAKSSSGTVAPATGGDRNP